MVQGVHKLVDERLKQIRELTLMLMYLTSWEERDTLDRRMVKKRNWKNTPSSGGVGRDMISAS